MRENNKTLASKKSPDENSKMEPEKQKRADSQSQYRSWVQYKGALFKG